MFLKLTIVQLNIRDERVAWFAVQPEFNERNVCACMYVRACACARVVDVCEYERGHVCVRLNACGVLCVSVCVSVCVCG